MAPRETKRPKYSGGELLKDATHVVGHPDGEVEFSTDESGTYTPKDDREEWALQQLGATPVRGGSSNG